MRAIVIGAGFAGAVAARILADGGFTVDLFERRDHTAGNMYDFTDDNGVLCHKYGPHLFRTSDENVWSCISKFGQWYKFVNYTSALIDSKHVFMPFNLNAIEQFFGEEYANKVEIELTRIYGEGAEIPVLELLQSDKKILSDTAQFFYEKDYSPYTQKQWGKGPKEIDPSVTARVPMRNSRENMLFRDPFQFLPVGGYHALFKDILNHPGINVFLNKNALDFMRVEKDHVLIDGQPCDYPVVYTGAVDELLDFKFGELPYRSVEFVYESHNIPQYQPTLGVCHPELATPFTRIVEYKHLMQYPHTKAATTIVKEIPMPYSRNDKKGNIPYYPMMTDKAFTQYSLYQTALAATQNLYLLGRLAEYRYYNMDHTIAAAMKTASTIIAKYCERG